LNFEISAPVPLRSRSGSLSSQINHWQTLPDSDIRMLRFVLRRLKFNLIIYYVTASQPARGLHFGRQTQRSQAF
jgi:hypothetical protein